MNAGDERTPAPDGTGAAGAGAPARPRVVFHLDMDAFYAAIEQHDDPSLRGKPLIVGGRNRRGVVLTASYEARPFGVHSAMPMVRALALCPHALVVPPRMARYGEVSRAMMSVLDRFSPHVEPLSLDEAFLEMTGSEGLFGPPERAAARLKDEVRAATGISCSVGVARNKFLAKLASDLEKPDGLTVVPFGREAEFIAPLAVRRLWGVGPRAATVLARLGIHTIGELARAPQAALARALGRASAAHFVRLAHAEDERQVALRSRHSIGSEVTLERDLVGKSAVLRELRRRCESVARELRRRGDRARGVRVKLRYSQSFRLATRQGRVAQPCDDSLTLYAAARELVERLDTDAPIRLVGAAAFGLASEAALEPEQLALAWPERAPGAAAPAAPTPSRPPPPARAASERRSKLEHALDDIVAKFGHKIGRGG